MAIQIGEGKKKKSKLFILLIIVVVGFVGFKVFKRVPVEINKTNTETISVGNIKNVDSTMKEINDIVENPIFQQLVTHNNINLQPESVGREDPFAN